MKKMSIRFLAMIVALFVLMTSAAMAEGAAASEKNMASLTVGNFSLSVDEESYSLPLYLTLTGGVDVEGERGLLVLDLSTAEQSAATGYAVVENGEIKAYLDGMDYGFVVPLEQLMQMLSEELGAAMADLSEQIPAELQTALTNLVTSTAALESMEEIDPAVLLTALGITAEMQGTTEVEIFEETVTADMATFDMPAKTIGEQMDALCAAIPELDAYWTDYVNLLDTAMTESGEEMTTEEALSMISMGVAGELYSTDTHLLAELTLSLSAEGETVYIPFSVAVATTDEGTMVDVILTMDVEGETLLINAVVNETLLETGSDVYTMFSMYIYDTETEEVETGFDLSMSSINTAEEVYYALGLYAVEYDDIVNLGFEYFGLPAEIAEDGAEVYNGMLGLYAYADDVEMNLSMDTCLELSTIPEGELLILPEGSINALEITEEQIEALENDIQVPVMQAAGVLMQDADLASLLLGAMQ